MVAQVISPISGTKLEIDSTKNAIKIKDPKPIPDAADDPKIIALASWAVHENNRMLSLSLKFSKVILAYVDYDIYFIKLEAFDGGVAKLYEAIVLVESSNSKDLLSFGKWQDGQIDNGLWF